MFNFSRNVTSKNIQTDSTTFKARASRCSQYTAEETARMNDIKKAASNNAWFDIYKGRSFSIMDKVSIEHLIPFSFGDNPEVRKLMGEDFDVNGLANTFPVGEKGNNERGIKSFVDIILATPDILDRFLNEMEKHYRHYKSDLVDGEAWAAGLYDTLSKITKGLAWILETEELYLFKQPNPKSLIKLA